MCSHPLRSLLGLLLPQFVHFGFCLELVNDNFIGVSKILLSNCFLQGFCEKRNSVSAVCAGLTRAIPPSLAGRAKSSHSVSFGGGLPVSAGISLVLMITSRGKRIWSMLGMVRVR